ncbi:MAG: hypothetical protein L6R45_11495 [Anaerolineae bacterium]|nr:hypothetical protein [Anaerolineae bacterium]
MQLPERRINAQSKVTLRRILPLPGEVLVQRGQQVEALTVVARAQTPHRYRLINVARQLGQPQVEMERVMLKEEGDEVKAHEVIARVQGGLPFLQRAARAPAAGQIAAIGPGWVLLETESTLVELPAFINGIIARIIPDRGVVIEASGAVIEAACGFGGETYGPLKRLVNNSSDILGPEAIDENLRNMIILAGRSLDEETLRQAEAAQVRGVIVGSIDTALLNLDPPVKVRVVATEGFGDIPMSPYTFGILGTLDGKEVSIRGHTPHLAPLPGQTQADSQPIIMATSNKASALAALSAEKGSSSVLAVGSRVRVTAGQYLGASGTIATLPLQPRASASGLVAPGAIVNLGEASPYIPLANLEQVV